MVFTMVFTTDTTDIPVLITDTMAITLARDQPMPNLLMDTTAFITDMVILDTMDKQGKG